MLYLKPPFHIIEGVAVFADHANERQFYFMPAMPKLTTILDPATGTDVPQIQLIKFRGHAAAAGKGGFLTFEVNLGVDPVRLESIAAELKRIHRLRDQPILAPVLIEDGALHVVILDTETPNARNGNGPSDDEPPRFVTKLQHAVKPSLYGDNQAIVSVELNEYGVDILEGSLKGELLPIGVVYALDFLALRPAFTVKVTADWDRVQTHFEESFSVGIMFASVEIDKVVDKLIEDQVVNIEVDSFLPEGEDAGSWVGRRDQAINDFKDMVLDTFFTPSVEPLRPEKDDWDKYGDTAQRVALLAATGGMGGICNFSYTKRDLTRIDQKRLNLTMNERVTVKRTIYPQATIKGLSRYLNLPRDAQGNVDLSRFVLEVDLDDEWFQERQVMAHALVNFKKDDVDSINATLNYDGHPKTMRLTEGNPSGASAWNSTVIGDAMLRPVNFQYRVNFRDVDTAERPGFVTSPPMMTDGDEFEISPRGERLYYLDEIQLGADLLPWSRYPSVSVEVRYDDPGNQIRLAETFMLTEQKREETWKRFRLDPLRDSYDVRVTYLAADHRDIVVDWRTTDQERLLIRDPRPAKRTVQVVPAVTWALVAMVLVEVRYVDDANGVDERRTLSFADTDEDRTPKVFEVNLVDPEYRVVGYSATIVLKDNRIIAVPPSMTMASTVIVRTDMSGHRVVTVRPPSIEFVARGIARIEAVMRYDDDEAGLSFEDRFTFDAPNVTEVFEYDFVAAERSGYTCVVTIIHTNGLTQERDLGVLNTDKLVLPAA